MKAYFPEVVQVIPKENYHVYIYFSDGKVTDYDMSPYLDGKVFRPLKDISVFMECCTIMNSTLAWCFDEAHDASKCVDIDPFVLYEQPAVNIDIA